jgi:hypothetical protein
VGSNLGQGISLFSNSKKNVRQMALLQAVGDGSMIKKRDI